METVKNTEILMGVITNMDQLLTITNLNMEHLNMEPLNTIPKKITQAIIKNPAMETKTTGTESHTIRATVMKMIMDMKKITNKVMENQNTGMEKKTTMEQKIMDMVTKTNMITNLVMQKKSMNP